MARVGFVDSVGLLGGTDMDIVLALLVVPVVWIVSEAVSKHAPRLFKRREKACEAPPEPEPVKSEVTEEDPHEEFKKRIEIIDKSFLPPEDRVALKNEATETYRKQLSGLL